MSATAPAWREFRLVTRAGIIYDGKMRLAFLLILLLPVACFGQSDKKQADPFDTTVIQKKIDELGVPTPDTVQQLERKASALGQAAKWQECADAYMLLARNANWLSNLIATGSAPFYNASDRSGVSISDADVKFEDLANSYKTKRNEATVYAAACYMRMQDTKRAVALLSNALEMISVHEHDLWMRARTDLYKVIQVNITPTP